MKKILFTLILLSALPSRGFAQDSTFENMKMIFRAYEAECYADSLHYDANISYWVSPDKSKCWYKVDTVFYKLNPEETCYHLKPSFSGFMKWLESTKAIKK